MTRKFKANKWTCASCSDVISSSYSGEFVTCKCGKTSIDETTYYCRYIGQLPKEMLNKKQEEINTNERSVDEDSRMASSGYRTYLVRTKNYIIGIFCDLGRLFGF